MDMAVAGLRFAPGRVPTVLFLLLFPLLVSLGMWQLSRADEKAALQVAMHERMNELPLDLNRNDNVAAGDRFHPARATGRFVASAQWLQDNRVRQMQAGYHVYSLFELTNSHRTLLVNRGWVAAGRDRAVLPDVSLPTGQFTLVGRLDNPASVGLRLGSVSYREPGVTVLPYLDVAELGQAKGLDVVPMALVLDEGQPGALVHDPLPVSDMGPEKHLGYAVQWFALALALLMIYVGVNVRRIRTEEVPR